MWLTTKRRECVIGEDATTRQWQPRGRGIERAPRARFSVQNFSLHVLGKYVVCVCQVAESSSQYLGTSSEAAENFKKKSCKNKLVCSRARCRRPDYLGECKINRSVSVFESVLMRNSPIYRFILISLLNLIIKRSKNAFFRDRGIAWEFRCVTWDWLLIMMSGNSRVQETRYREILGLLISFCIRKFSWLRIIYLLSFESLYLS